MNQFVLVFGATHSHSNKQVWKKGRIFMHSIDWELLQHGLMNVFIGTTLYPRVMEMKKIALKKCLQWLEQ
jgi:hypothetical protein